MEYFAFLTAISAILVVLTWVAYRKRGDLGVPVGVAALYYWSLFGAWFIVIDKTGGYSGVFYSHLELKLFPVALDANYMLAIELYGAFLVAVLVTLLAMMKGPRLRPLPRLVLRHNAMLLMAGLAGIASFLIMRKELSTAWALHQSAYRYTRMQSGQWFTLHQLLNRVALIPTAVGLASLLAGERSRYFVSVRKRFTLAGYLIIFAGMAVFTFVLGNKNEVLMSLVTGLLAYLGSVRRPNLVKAALTLAVGLWFLYTIDFFRGVPVAEMTTAVADGVQGTTEVGRFLTSSHEAYEAHVSLYGVLAAKVPPLFGYSFYSLACSVIPRVLWPDRPQDIYIYYSQQVGVVRDQGYSLHHATGWYLNFGIAGVVLGGVVLGLIWAACLNAQRKVRSDSGLIFRLFAAVAPWLFAACLPSLVRAGPEGYKGFLVEGFLIPLSVLVVACRAKRARRRVASAEVEWMQNETPVEMSR